MPETAPPEPSHPDTNAAASAIALTARRQAAAAGRRTRQQPTPSVTADDSPSENFTSEEEADEQSRHCIRRQARRVCGDPSELERLGLVLRCFSESAKLGEAQDQPESMKVAAECWTRDRQGAQ